MVAEIADRVAVMYAGRVVEEGSRLAVLGDPRHPYTRGLLRAMPSRVAPGEDLFEIPGVVPAPDAWPTGCRFQDRCPEVFPRCREEAPAITAADRSGDAIPAWVRCHAVAEGRRV